MKKILAVLLSSAMLLSVFAIAAFAEGETITFHLDHRTGEEYTLEIPKGTVFGNDNVLKDLKRDGYVFLGWYNNRTCTPYNFDNPMNSNTSVYARWQREGTSPMFASFDLENIFQMFWEIISQNFKSIGNLFS